MPKMTNNEFLNTLQQSTESNNKPIKVIITPIKGWKYELHCEVTDILHEEDMTFISNAFSHQQQPITVDEFINNFESAMKEKESLKNNPIVVEVYGLDGEEINNQIALTYIEDVSELSITEDDNYTYINVKIDDIATY